MVDKLMKLINDAALNLQWSELHPVVEERERYYNEYRQLNRRIKLIKKLISR